MKIYLVLTDFSKNSDNAFSFATELAKKENSKILLLHVLTIDLAISDMVGLIVSGNMELAKLKSIEKLKNICNEIKKSENVQCEFIHKTGNLVHTIVDTIKSIKPHLVIMGTKKDQTREKLKDSTTIKLIEQTDCPVISIPEHLKYAEFKKITYATDYRLADKSALKILIDTAKPFNAQINSLHISNEKNNQNLEMEMLKKFSNYISENLQYHDLSFQLIQGKKVEKELHKHLKENKPNLIAISNCTNANTDKSFKNNITKELLYKGMAPLLIIPDKEKMQLILN